MKKKLFIVVNVDWFFLSHRLPIALEAKNRGLEVTIVTANTGKKDIIESYGLNFIDFPFQRSGSNVIHETKCVFALTKLYKKYNPDIIHHVTLKASILGSLAAKVVGAKNIINAISGLGYNFTQDRNGILQRFLKFLIKIAFKSKSFYFILQNPDDVLMIKSLKLVSDDKIILIKGSGVDLNKFSFQNVRLNEKVRFLFPARILQDKGVIEYIKAAERVKNSLLDKAEFILAGDCDKNNLAVISEEKLLSIIDNNYIKWIGHQSNMFSIFKDSDIVVLPSYREGLPKALIEAAAVGRPIITTDVPGCKECVIDGYNGFIVPAKNIEKLADSFLKLYNNYELRLQFGTNSRKLAEKDFSLSMVIDKTMNVYNSILKCNV